MTTDARRGIIKRNGATVTDGAGVRAYRRRGYRLALMPRPGDVVGR